MAAGLEREGSFVLTHRSCLLCWPHRTLRWGPGCLTLAPGGRGRGSRRGPSLVEGGALGPGGLCSEAPGVRPGS